MQIIINGVKLEAESFIIKPTVNELTKIIAYTNDREIEFWTALTASERARIEEQIKAEEELK